MPEQQARQQAAAPQQNNENRVLDAENDSATPDEQRAEEHAIARDSELHDETPQVYEQEIDEGGETPSGKRTGPDEAWLKKLPDPNER